VAVALTKGVGTMWTAYAFVMLAFIGLFAILGLLNPIVALLVAWASQIFFPIGVLAHHYDQSECARTKNGTAG
jgi:hypothetical protein